MCSIEADELYRSILPSSQRTVTASAAVPPIDEGAPEQLVETEVVQPMDI